MCSTSTQGHLCDCRYIASERREEGEVEGVGRVGRAGRVGGGGVYLPPRTL